MRREHILVEILTPEREFVRQALPTSTRANLRWNLASTAHVAFDEKMPAVGDLLVDGAAAAVWMVTVDGNTLSTERLLEGTVGDPTGEGPFGTVTFPIIDDFEQYSEILGWQDPDAPISNQSGAEYDRYTGPTETRTKAVIQAAITRLGLPWDVATDLGRGTDGRTDLRMHKLADKLLPALNTDRLQLILERNRNTGRWLVDVREGQLFPRPLTIQSGVLASWRWKKQRRTATRVIAGGAGEGTAREFNQVIDTTAETTLNRIREVFVDARMAAAGADLTVDAAQALAEAAPKAGITAQLRETSWFRFPTAYRLGDRIPVQVGPVTVEDVITEIEITHTTGDGFRVVPTLGLTVDDPQNRLVQFVQTLATSVRSLEKR